MELLQRGVEGALSGAFSLSWRLLRAERKSSADFLPPSEVNLQVAPVRSVRSLLVAFLFLPKIPQIPHLENKCLTKIDGACLDQT